MVDISHYPLAMQELNFDLPFYPAVHHLTTSLPLVTLCVLVVTEVGVFIFLVTMATDMFLKGLVCYRNIDTVWCIIYVNGRGY